MKTQTILIALSILITGSCNNNTETKEETKEIIPKTNEPAACYEYAKDSSKVRLNITIVENVVTGDLQVDYYQKDKNNGSIQGEMKGDTLFADYLFVSEGTNSVREVAFLKKGNEWVEGYGEVVEQNGRFIFKNKAALIFNNNIVLQKVSCN